MKAGDFDWFRSGRRHPHRSAKRNKNYREKDYAQRQHAQIRRRFRGRLDRSNGGAVGQGRTFQLGALMPLSMLRCNPPREECGRKVRQHALRPVLRASGVGCARLGARFYRRGSRLLYVGAGGHVNAGGTASRLGLLFVEIVRISVI